MGGGGNIAGKELGLLCMQGLISYWLITSAHVQDKGRRVAGWEGRSFQITSAQIPAGSSLFASIQSKYVKNASKMEDKSVYVSAYVAVTRFPQWKP